jgi:hypothetical protein
MVLQKDLGPRSEEHFFQIRPQERSLIQKFGLSDSNIARFFGDPADADDFCNTIGP